MRAGIPVLLIPLGLLMATVSAGAALAAPPPSVPLTLGEAVNEALARNRDLAVSRTEVDAARGRLAQAARYPFNPELSLEGEGGRGTAREGNEHRGVGGGGVGLSQVIEIRGQRDLRVAAAQANLDRATWTLRDKERQVIAETTTAFAELRVAQERLGLAGELLALATRLEETARARVGAGDAPEVDAVRAGLEVRRAVNRITLAEAAVNAAVRGLGLLVGAAPDVQLRATGPLLLAPVPERREALQARARAERPDVKAAEAAAASARAAQRLVEVERFIPTLTLSAAYSDGLEFDSRSRLARFGLSIPLPLWNRRDGDLDTARAEVDKQEAERERLVAVIATEVATAWQQFTAAQQVVEEFVRRIVPGQDESAKLIDEGYRLGEFPLTDALLAQRDLFETRSAYLEAVAAYNVASIALVRAVGLRP